MDRSYVSLLERGIKSPTLRMVFRLAGILGVTAAEVVARVEMEMAGTTGEGKAGTVGTGKAGTAGGASGTARRV